MDEKTILVIDDDDLICTLVSKYLEREGYHVVTALNGPDGIEKYRTEKPDLVVLDVAMPEMSGFAAASRIRRIQHDEERPHTPIIILTAYARSFFQSAGSEAGIDSYLTKPITPKQLLEHVQPFLEDEPSD
jgi:CheY-like chemotaxis protein